MICILEGPDGAGKSTLARALSDVLHVPVYKASGSPLIGDMTVRESQMIDAQVWSFVKMVQPDLIFDRAFVSEWVYGHAFEREGLNEFLISALDKQAAELGAKGVLLRFSDPWAAQKRTDDHVKDIETLDRLDELYVEYVSRSEIPWLVLDAESPLAKNAREVYRHVSKS